ncbi:CAAX amino terminal protease self- immunity [Pseudodesulfovibrio hydrargyri]|uniref:CAAX amino terminal protease self-immunity n=1 Tax=Pseudodesulfovibrio hydrargyri TaxID=2125990 RepID=A0A1J5N782_9BACT|nr:CAAX prenyl protease-related protein [Pseudodesulfovibrio hydrargyri]OIQ49159.1 CAAX amino terminal protease self- immunity [Pseudodesulfovibrio hydrargyri]
MRPNTHDLPARVIPFGLYMAFVAALEIPALFGGEPPSPSFILGLYPAKIALVATALLAFRKFYTDLDWGSLRRAVPTALSVCAGAAVFLLWINLDLPWAVQGELTSYDPTEAAPGWAYALIFARVAGAVVVVPVMEELFWRSFLARYLIDRDFMAVRAGTFTLFTFPATAVLFGLEHQLYLAGVLAGLAYNAIYWKTKSLAQCILSHAVTNGLLAAYVLTTQNWRFW